MVDFVIPDINQTASISKNPALNMMEHSETYIAGRTGIHICPFGPSPSQSLGVFEHMRYESCHLKPFREISQKNNKRRIKIKE